MKVHSSLITPLMTAESSKLRQLQKDIRNLHSRDPNMRAVVFTQFLKQKACIEAAVKSTGINVYSLCGSTNAKVRDSNIRMFQSLATPGPAVFVVTMRAGSVGMTLTAASHVFLMEPCINPATEIQAAGRIHRLGQTKPVGVTKYAYGGSLETNIKTLHDRIVEGTIEITANRIPRAALSILLNGL
jgi:DNA repair protein RAD16